MNWKTGRHIAAFFMFCVFAGLYLANGDEWIFPRKLVLASQITTCITWIGPKLAVVLVILLLTAVLGRWYCSLLCPCGLVQELFTRLGRRLGIARLGYMQSPNPSNMLVVFTILAITGFTWLLNLLDPLGLFGRLMEPTGEIGRSFLGRQDIMTLGGAALLVAAALGLGLMVVVPLFFGRIFCDRACPVGALLKVASSGSGRRVTLDRNACASCGKCEQVCQARCIDAKARHIDAKRCLLCMDCLTACPTGGVAYSPWKPKERRRFLDAATAGMCAGAYLLSRPFRGMIHQRPPADPPVIPPGMNGIARLRQRCVTCQACVLSCPVSIIRAGNDSRPTLDYDLGYCQYNCQLCAGSCPAGVFQAMPLADKHVTRIARTSLVSTRCVVVKKGTACGACAEVCPTHAVSMRDQGEGKPTIPDFDADYCIGCGACYHVCPTEPRSFIIQGLEKHERSLGIRPVSHESPAAPETPPEKDELQDFPF